MSLMQPRSKQAIWANDDVGITDNLNATAAANGGGGAVAVDDGDGSDDDLYEDLPAVSSDSESDDDGDDDDDALNKKKKHGDAVVVDQGVSDMDYLKSRVRKNFDEDDEAKEEEEEEEKEDVVDSDDDEEESGDDDEDMTSSSSDDDKDDDEDDGGKEKENEVDGIFNGKTRLNRPTTEVDPFSGGGGAVNGHRGHDEAEMVAAIAQTGRLFVRNLPYSATEEDLRAAFEVHGDLEEVHLVLDKVTRRSKGFSLIQFSSPEDAVTAHAALDRSIFMGRLMHVLPGMKAPSALAAEAAAAAATVDGEQAGEGGQEEVQKSKGTSSYKRKKEEEMKASAGNKVAWNSLFMRSDTVAEAVAAHYGVNKSDLLDPNAPDMAVRMALGETQVIAETKTSLAAAGVDVEALENAAAAAGKGKKSNGSAAAAAAAVVRSDCILLVKNLPYSADAGELEALFSGMGPVLRLILPPTKTLALVEFSEAQDARRAFKTLAYKRYQSVPIYLEWAPARIFSGPPKAAAVVVGGEQQQQPLSKTTKSKSQAGVDKARADEDDGVKTTKTTTTRPGDVTADLGAGAAEDGDVDSCTVFVKNLSFTTEEASLSTLFTEAVENAGGAVRAVKIARKKTKSGHLLSSGFGFVECDSETAARDVIKALQGTSLDGHRLVLQLAQATGGGGDAAAAAKKKGAAAAAAAGGKGATKIVVRNLAFEASRKDMLGLFTPFGAVKNCRLPRKFDGSHRGFAFVEFATPQEARGAVEAVAGAHLYGRRLVIEWAEDEGGLDELRAKTANTFRGDEAALVVRGGEKRGADEDDVDEEEIDDGGKKKKKEKKQRRN